jgi:hypothetical protein
VGILYLGLSSCLVCTIGTPVADMLAHSPPLPLVIDHIYEHHDLTAEDEKGMTLALNRRGRVRRIPLWMFAPDLRKLIIADFTTRFEHRIYVASCYLAPSCYPSNGILVTHDCRGPRRTRSCRVPPVHLLPASCPAPIAFTHVSAGIAPNCDPTRYSQSRCGRYNSRVQQP